MSVELSFEFMWCANHLEPFRATWPKSAALAMLNLFSASAADERIIAAAQGDADRLSPVLREHEFWDQCIDRHIAAELGDGGQAEGL